LGIAGLKVFYAGLLENANVIAVMWDLNSLQYAVLTVLACGIAEKSVKSMLLEDRFCTVGYWKESDVRSVFHNLWSTKLCENCTSALRDQIQKMRFFIRYAEYAVSEDFLRDCGI